MILVNETNVAYAATGADMTLTASKWVASSVVTVPPGTTKLQFVLRLKSAAIVYLRSQAADGAANSGVAFSADQWVTFEMLWTTGRTFSVRFSATQANVYDLIINAVGEGI